MFGRLRCPRLRSLATDGRPIRQRGRLARNPRPLRIESLEDRQVLANIGVTDAYLTDANGGVITPAAVGQLVYVEARFTTTDLPASAQYQFRFAIDGVPITSGFVNWGAGVAGDSFWIGRLGVWTVQPGAHTVDVLLNSSGTVNEGAGFNYLDNSRQFTFTPVTFSSSYSPQTRFITPLAGTPYAHWSIVNYIDLDPGPGTRDYRGVTGNAAYTYNGHDALDITLPNFAAQDIGLPVYAAADGVVREVRENQFDRNTCPTVCMGAGNYVTLDHGNGWATVYYHLRQNSAAVSVGDFVRAGTVVGLVGSSGNSSDSHLHFTVEFNGRTVETYVAPNLYWQSPLPYSGDVPGVLDFGITDHYPPPAELRERPAQRDRFLAANGQRIQFWASLHGLLNNDQLSVTWKRPNGTTLVTHSYNFLQTRYGWIDDAIEIDAAAPAGTWTVELRRNGTLLVTDTFLVTSGAALVGNIEFNSLTYHAVEGVGNATLRVTRNGNSGTATVQYQTFAQNALAGSDFTSVSGTLTFSPGEVIESINIPILDDSLHEGLQWFWIALSNPTGGATLGGNIIAEVRIHDDDALLRYAAASRRLDVRAATDALNDSVTVSHPGAMRFDVNGEVVDFPAGGVDTVQLFTGDGDDAIRVGGTLRANTWVDAGNGNDSLTLTYLRTFRDFHDQNENPPFAHTLSADGGSGFDVFTVDDTSAVDRAYYLHGNHLSTYDSGAPLGMRVDFVNFQSSSLYAGPYPNEFYIRSTSPEIPAGQQTTIFGGADFDTFIVYPRDEYGNPSIFSNLGILGGGGNDSIIYDDAASSTGAVWTINNPFGANTQDVSVAGGALVGSYLDLENVYLRGSAGDDVFNVESYRNGSALRVAANAGSDTLNLTPTSGQLSADVTSISYFDYDGGPDEDYFNLYNQYADRSWRYTREEPWLYAETPAYYARFDSSAEQYQVFGGAFADEFYVGSTPGGSTTRLAGGGGGDAYEIGSVSGGTQGILGRVQLVGASDNETVRIDDGADIAGRTFHVGESGIGYTAGDDLFGPGGYVEFSGIGGTLTVRGGPAADTIYATPHATTALVLDGNEPGEEPGDSLLLNFAGAANPTETELGPYDGVFTFDDRAMLTYISIEQRTTIDQPPSLPADLNADCQVDVVDLAILQMNLGAAGTREQGDLDADGIITAGDLVLFLAEFGSQVSEHCGVDAAAAAPAAAVDDRRLPSQALRDESPRVGERRLSAQPRHRSLPSRRSVAKTSDAGQVRFAVPIGAPLPTNTRRITARRVDAALKSL